MRTTETLIVGAGQAGLALSSFLSRARHDHVVVDRGRIGERWRSERWSSLTLLTPNWLNRLPGSPPHAEPDGFLSRPAFVDYLERYARSFAAPVAEGVTVLSVERHGSGFRVQTDGGDWCARRVVVASGHADEPAVPSVAASTPRGVVQLHATGYRSPGALLSGGVLVVGAGPSGQQIAAELRRAGREVVLAVGRHAWLPRRYRGFDIWYWLEATGELDRTREEVPDEAAASAPSLVLTGANGGERLDLGLLSDLGVVVTGRLRGFSGQHAIFAGDLAATVGEADRRMRRVLAKIDDYIERRRPAGDVPEGDRVPEFQLRPGPRTLDLYGAGVSTVIWATGYWRAYPWLHVDVLASDGEIVHRRGVTPVPGLYAVGLRFQHRRKSHFIGGVGEDARFIARHILGTSECRPQRPSRARREAPLRRPLRTAVSARRSP
jgi:putative flavoprotein involved in K+ transport